MSTIPQHPTGHAPATSDAVSGSVPAGQRYALPCNSLFQRLAELGESVQSRPELVQGIAGLMIQSGASAMWVVSRNREGQWQSPTALVGDSGQILEFVQPAIHRLLEGWTEPASLKELVCQDISQLPASVLLVAPVVMTNQVVEVLVMVAPRKSPRGLPLDWALASCCQTLALWQVRQQAQLHQSNLATVSGVLGITDALNRTSNRLETAITLVNEIKGVTRSQQVALLFQPNSAGTARLTALSDVEHFDPQAESTQVIEALVTGLDDQPFFWQPAQSEETRADNVSDNRVNATAYCNLFGYGGVGLLPLKRQDGGVFGWIVLAFSEASLITESLQQQLAQLIQLLAGQLETVIKTQRSLTLTALDNARQAVRQRWARILGVVALAGGLLMCIPFTYNIPCDCQLQLTRRRFVAAPYEGLLEKTLVESGDVVQAGQVLARMDGRQLRMELSALSAQLDSERKRRDSALARGNIAESQIASSEMSRLNSEIRILESRIGNTEIRSPLDGVVVSGDLDKAEGVPMQMGQTLFEVGPLEQMLVELHIPERELRFAEVGMSVDFEFDAFPFQTFSGTLQRIHPRAELVDADSVFVAEFKMDNPDGQLRPGMVGRARVHGHRYPLGWNLFHNAWDSARRWLLW